MNPLNVFLVEDDPLLQKQLAALIGSVENLKIVGTAQDEASATEWLRARPCGWGLIVLDLLLSRGTGFGVLSKLEPAGDRCRVCVLTNSATPRNRALCKAMGVGAVFDKTEELGEFVEYCEERVREFEAG